MVSTRKQVAIHANVSEATVSHVLNKTKYVSPRLTEKVLEAVKELNYHPNLIARSLVTKVSNQVAILVDDIKNSYYGEITEGMGEIACQEGYIVSLICAKNMTPELFKDLISRKIDGVFFTSMGNDFGQIADEFKQYGIATVNGGSYSCQSSTIGIDYSQSIDMMIHYLYNLGHRKIGFLSGIPINDYNQRYIEYSNSMKKYGIQVNEDLIVKGTYPYTTTIIDGYNAMKKLLEKKKKVTAVFAVNDLMALGAMKAIKEAKLKIPEDISVIGCDDIFFAEYASPALTTIWTPKKEMGKKAMYLLLDQINGRSADNVLLKSDFIIRESTGEAKQ